MNPIAVARHMLQNSAMKIPQVKSCVKRWHSLGMGRSEAKILPVMEKLIGMLGRAGGDLTGQTLLELGPGQTPDLMIGALMLRAARVIGLDISRDMPKHARESCAHIDLRRWLKAAMREGRLGCHSTVNESHVSTAGRISEAKFSLPLYDGKRFPLPDDSVDIVWSNCVLEHVSDYDSLMHETWRTLKPGGLAIHIIHLQDHLTFNNGGDWLRFLTYNERKWNAMFSHRTTWCNRLRSSQWHELFEEKPWEIVEFAEQTAPFHPQFERSRLASPFNSMSERDLAVSWVHTTLRKPTDVSLATPYPIAKLDAGGKPVLIKRRFNQPCRSSASGFRSSTARTNLAVHHKVV